MGLYMAVYGMLIIRSFHDCIYFRIYCNELSFSLYHISSINDKAYNTNLELTVQYQSTLGENIMFNDPLVLE